MTTEDLVKQYGKITFGDKEMTAEEYEDEIMYSDIEWHKIDLPDGLFFTDEQDELLLQKTKKGLEDIYVDSDPTETAEEIYNEMMIIKSFCKGLLKVIEGDDKYGPDYVFTEIVDILKEHAGE